MRIRRLLLVFSLALAAGIGALSIGGQDVSGAVGLPDGFHRSRVAGGLDRPTAMALAPGNRIFVTEKDGALRVIQNGTLLAKPFVKLSVDSEGERGLLGVAIDPEFSSNHYLYAYYTTSTIPHHNRVVRFKADGNRAVPGSEQLILRINNLNSQHGHNGGAIHFGEGGKLYVAVGDNDVGENSQSLDTLKGKILRINKDGSIPKSNPFYERASGRYRAIWAMGLRNPFSFAIERGTGRIFINDVGQKAWEEIDQGRAGANYGWPIVEGPEDRPRFTPPVFAYAHGDTATTGCAITGGAFYRPVNSQFPASFDGDYFFGDYCGGWIRRYDPATDRAMRFATGVSAPVDLVVPKNGTLLYLDHSTGAVNRISYSG